MNDMVAMTHPNLPGRVIFVKRRLAAARTGAGWEIQTSEPTQVVDTESKSRRRRARNEDEN